MCGAGVETYYLEQLEQEQNDADIDEVFTDNITFASLTLSTFYIRVPSQP
jgi:hypothetical protein